MGNDRSWISQSQKVIKWFGKNLYCYLFGLKGRSKRAFKLVYAVGSRLLIAFQKELLSLLL